MQKKIAVLGSTGSIGTKTLEVARGLGIDVVALSANENIDLLEEQVRDFKPRLAAVGNDVLAAELKKRLGHTKTEVLSGPEGFEFVATAEEAETVVISVVGSAGILPTLKAVSKGKRIALANKETLVAAGQLVMAEAKKHKVDIFPLDSEHSAVFQCLTGNDIKHVARIILTASGGPFKGWSFPRMQNVTVEEALRHPNWKMGRKITIDSATLMNKGFEVIEASWLFGMEAEKIEVVIHPQSIVHSMVEYVDGSVMAQLGAPDMRIPIQLALTFPERVQSGFSKLDILKMGSLTFEKPDYEAFPCLRLAYDAIREGGTMPAVLNAANEAAVSLFLREKIRFTDIPGIIAAIMESHVVNRHPCLDDIIEVDRWAKKAAAAKAKAGLF